jgi:geranylgeranyl diphosphate synthase type I
MDISQIRSNIDGELRRFADAQSTDLNQIGIELSPVAGAMSRFIIEGGKRFRPIFAYLGYLGAGGEESASITRACSALELVHVCALMHDDVMDGSDTRRSAPAIHRYFESLHRSANYQGDAEKFGVAAAILLGDLALVWADRLLIESGISDSQLIASLPLFTEMREELMSGQYLDVLEGALATASIERSLKIARYKSGKYSIERPLHFGAALAGGSAGILASYSEYGLPLGEAFQLRDDLLGVFGDPKITGKPAGDDLREGKRTVLIAMAVESSTDKAREELGNSLGRSDLSLSQIDSLREIITKSGAVERCEQLIADLRDKALLALQNSEISSTIRPMLEEMAHTATARHL